MSAPYDFPGNSDLSAIGIFNVLDQNYGDHGNGGMGTGKDGGKNRDALQAAVNAALAAGGGLVFIPCGIYKIAGTIMISLTTDVGLIIAGSSGGTALVQQNAVDSFSVQSSVSDNKAGVRFQDLLLQYGSSATSGTAISVSHLQNVSCERVFFSNCPQAVSYGDNALQCGLFDCTVEYGGASTAPMVSIGSGAAETHIHNCVIRQTDFGNGTGIEILDASGVYVTNSHISDFSIGISIKGGGANALLLHAHFSNVVSESWESSVRMKPTTSGGKIYQIFFDNCTFALGNGSEMVTPGIYIDTDGGPNSNVSDILFSNCMCYQWKGPGIQINSGQNIQIIGGRYGSCAVGSTMTTSGGIAITGAAANVSIVGADCSGTVPSYMQQPYGISVTAAVAGGYIRGCNLTGNKNGPVYATSPVRQLEITDCAGYNDQGKYFATVPLRSPFKNTTFGYFGPIAFYVSGSGVTQISIDGHQTGLTSGGFTLSPEESAEITATGSPSIFAVGQ
jgi:hypothetical protein